MPGTITGDNNQVTINITDIVPPENMATIDKNGMVGNTYSKTQFDQSFSAKSEEIDTKIENIQQMVESDFRGTLKPTDAAPTEDGTYKPAISSSDDKPSDPASTADWGKVYANAGNLRAKDGYDTLFYKSGTVWKKSETKMPEALDRIPTWVAAPYPAGKQVFNEGKIYEATQDVFASDIPGGSPKWKEMIASSEVAAIFDPTNSNLPQAGKPIWEYITAAHHLDLYPVSVGSIIDGSSAAGLQAGNYYFIQKYEHNNKYNVHSIKFKPSRIGTYSLVIGTVVNGKFVERKTFDLTASALGVQVFNVDEYLMPGEYFGFKTSSTSTQKQNIPEIKATPSWSYFAPDYSADLVPDTSKLCFQFEGTEEVLSKNPIVLKADLDGFTLSNQQQLGNINGNNPSQNLSFEAFYILKLGKTGDYYIGEMKVDCVAGEMNFATGLIDQHNVFIQNETFSMPVVSGVNTLAINRHFDSNSYLAIKLPGVRPKYNSPQLNSFLFASSPYTGTVGAMNFSFALSVAVYDYSKSVDSVAKYSDIQKIDEKINTLSSVNVITADNGNKYKIGANNDGTVKLIPTNNFSRLMHFGNSILKHPITSFWWGNWGMAASKAEFDYAHILLAKLKERKPAAINYCIDAAYWEQSPTTFDKSQFDADFAAFPNPDFIDISLGDNGVYNANFKEEYAEFIDYVRSKAPNAFIFCCTPFFPAGNKATDIMSVCAQKNITCIDMSDTFTSEYRSYIGATVYDAAGNPHTVDHSGVASHPNDSWMALKASRIIKAVGL